jgi:hypothetical protein
MCGGVGFAGAGVAFGDEAAVDGLEFREAGDELGSWWPVDLGAQLKSESLLELVPLGSEPSGLLPGDGEVGR